MKSWNDHTTAPCVLNFVNASDESVRCLWVTPDNEEAYYATVQPGAYHAQETYTSHAWRLVGESSGAMLGEYVGPDAVVTVYGGGRPHCVCPGRDKAQLYNAVPACCPSWGAYRHRGTMCGIQIWAYDCVGENAIEQAALLLHYHLMDVPRDILERVAAAGAELALIGCEQVTSDLPPHRSLKGCSPDETRSFDHGTRGLGGSRGCPVCSCGEENVTMVNDRWYSQESILIHELAHSVMALGMTEGQVQEVEAAFRAAKAAGLYDQSCYMMANEHEYWAEGVQAYFDATVRTDVNRSSSTGDGINTRDKLQAHDPRLAAIIREVYGDGPWRYGHSSAQPFWDAPRNDAIIARLPFPPPYKEQQQQPSSYYAQPSAPGPALPAHGRVVDVQQQQWQQQPANGHGVEAQEQLANGYTVEVQQWQRPAHGHALEGQQQWQQQQQQQQPANGYTDEVQQWQGPAHGHALEGQQQWQQQHAHGHRVEVQQQQQLAQDKPSGSLLSKASQATGKVQRSLSVGRDKITARLKAFVKRL